MGGKRLNRIWPATVEQHRQIPTLGDKVGRLYITSNQFWRLVERIPFGGELEIWVVYEITVSLLLSLNDDENKNSWGEHLSDI